MRRYMASAAFCPRRTSLPVLEAGRFLRPNEAGDSQAASACYDSGPAGMLPPRAYHREDCTAHWMSDRKYR